MEETEALSFINALIPFALIVFIIAVGVVLLTQQFRKNLYKQQLEQEALRTAHQRALLRTTIEVQEGERKRIAQDLHDELGAVLSMGRMQLMQLEEQPELTEGRLPFVRELMESALDATRRISHELMPLQLAEQGLPNALHRLADQAEATGKVSVQMDVADNLGDITMEQALGLYRTIAEMTNNTLKHAEASTIRVSLRGLGDAFVCKYADDGKGLPSNPKGSSEKMGQTGLGLQGLEGRVSAMNGVLEIGGKATGGFSAIITLPKKGEG